MKRLLLFIAASLAFALPASAQGTLTRTLPGGATLVVLREPDARLIIVKAFFRIGVADENAVGEGGLSALLARTWAAGGEYRTAGQIALDIGEFGAFGALSTREYIELSAISDPGGIKEATQTLLMNVVASPLFPPDAVASAKRSVQRDRAIRADGLLTDADFRLRTKVFALSPDGRDPLGDPESAASATPQGLRRFFDRTVGRDGSRAVFVVAGNVDPDDAETMVRSSLAAGGWGGLTVPPKARIAPLPVPTDRLPANLKVVDLRREAPACYVMTGFIAPGTAADPDAWAALTVLEAVLSGGKDSRLFPLRDQPTGDKPPVGYDISSRLDPGRSSSLWTFMVSGATSVEPVRAMVQSAIHSLSDGTRPVTAEELARAKAYLKGQHRRERQRLSDRASAVGLAELRGLGSKFETDYDAIVDAVTLDAVNGQAKQVFGGNSLTVVTGNTPAP